MNVPISGSLTKAHSGDAGYDLVASHGATIHTLETVLIDADVTVEIPEGHVGLVCSRSGLALKHSIAVLNAPGVIDSGYRGKIGAILHNFGMKKYEVHKGDRIAQLLIIPLSEVNLIQREIETTTDRGEGGFGSSGN